MDKLLENYRQLLQIIQDKNRQFSESKLSVFTFVKGNKYNSQILIVGRAVNGWNSFEKENITSKSQEIENNLLNDDLQWVLDQWGDTTIYNTNKSAFWRVNKKIADSYFGEKEDWVNYLAWTNLYKVSKEKRGNPSNRLCDLQLEICKTILFREIELLKPRFVIFLTGWGWAQWFLKGNLNVVLKQTSQNEFIKCVGTLYESSIIVGQHPQGKSELRQVDEIIHQIAKLKINEPACNK